MKSNSLMLSLILLYSYCLPIHSQDNKSQSVYNDSQVAEIRITMNQADLDWMYENPQSDSMHLAQVHFKNAQIDEVIDSVGIRIRGNTSRVSYKKSLKLSFNTFIDGGDFYNLEKINLNGEHNDPSIVRSKLCWDFFNSIGVVSTRAAHAAVYINDKYYGLYISVEHIDEEFLQKNYQDDSGNLWKCLFGSDLTYLGSNPDLYKFENDEGIRPYDLIRNEEIDDYSELARLIDTINNSSTENFEIALESILNVNGVLKYFAANILVGGWDDYWSLSNNFYLYHNPSLDKFDLIPYDYDNTFGITWWDIDWSSVNPYTFAQIYPGPRPLVDRMLQSPKYRNLFTHLLEYYSDNYFDTPVFYSKLNDYKLNLQPYADVDTFRLVDWGFTIEHFLNSYNQSGFFYENGIIVPKSIQEFIENRTSSIRSQINYIDAPPVIYDMQLSGQTLLPNESLSVHSSVFSNKGLDSVQVEVNINGGNKYYFEMEDQSVQNSLIIEEADLWGITLPPFGESKNITIRIKATDNSGNTAYFPYDGVPVITASPVSGEIIISEVMSSNSSVISDGAGEYEDWIELYNPQETAIDLSGKYLTDKMDNLTKWQFPEGMTISNNEYILMWCDEDQEQGEDHTNFKLSSEGEFIAVVDSDGISIIDSITIPAVSEDLSYARDSEGNWAVTSSVTPGSGNVITDLNNKIPDGFAFNLSAYPNPFNPETTLNFEVDEPMSVELSIFDILGRRIWSVRKNDLKAGVYKLKWNGTDGNGVFQSSGIYFARILGDDISRSIKLLLLR